MPGGRPSKMTPEVLGKLEQAFAIDATIEEACFYADINPDTYYAWKKAHPELSERMERLRNTPILAARQTLATAVKSDAQTALKYLERKRRAEFASRQELTGADGEQLGVGLSAEQAEQLLRARAQRHTGDL